MSSITPEISIITPVFNGIQFIESCIRNVIEQECREAEHIIVDGGSDDGSVEVIRKYAQQYAHIRWISEADQGQSDAMNKGIAAAASRVIGFLNVDDYYEAGVLREVLSRFKALPEVTLLVGNCNIWDEDGKLLTVSKPAQISLFNLLKGKYDEAFPMNPSAYFYHKSLHNQIGPYMVDEHLSMDVHFLFKAVQKAKVVYVDRTWGNYRYLRETKTFRDVERGMNEVRVRSITEHYRKLQPFHLRAYLLLTEGWSRLLRAARSAGSALKRP